jgi:hypothetical protein
MIPTIVIRNKPAPYYQTHYSTPGDGQRQQVLDLQNLYTDLNQTKQQLSSKNIFASELKTQQKNILGERKVSTNKNTSKSKRREKKLLEKENDRIADKIIKEYIEYENEIELIKSQILEIKAKISIIEKHIDYCALFTASLPNISIMDETSVWKSIRNKPGPYVVRAMASKKYIDYATETQQDYIFLENGYFGNYKNLVNKKSKKQWHRICVNEMQQESILDVPSDRWQQLVSADQRLQWPGWKKSGSKILLVVPSSKPCQYYNQDVHQWKIDTITQIKQHTDREIVIREKASRNDRTQKRTIYDALDDDIFCMVTYQSIAAVESIAYGIPVFALAPSAAKQLSLSDLSKIETPYYPDEDLVYKWCCSLAYGQFSLEEMLNGRAWNMVQENQSREKISC